MKEEKVLIEKKRGLAVDLEQFPHGEGTRQYLRSKGIADALGIFDPSTKSNIPRYRILPQFAHLLHSPLVGHAMRMRGNRFSSQDPRETAETKTMELFNHQFLTYNQGDARYPDDSLNIIDPVGLIKKCFASGHEDNWPTMILTTNHALTSDHTHIAGIMRGVRQMIEHAHGKPLNYVAHPDEVDNFKGKTLILSSCFTQPTPHHNGAELLDRLQELENNTKQVRRIAGSIMNAAPALLKEWTNAGAAALKDMTTPTTYSGIYFPSNRPNNEHISPAARRLSKFLLAMIVTEPERIHFDAPCSEVKLITGDAQGRRPSLPDYMQVGEAPLHFRSDASRVLSKVCNIGYSKGGNMVTDAVRLLKDEIQSLLREEGRDSLSVQRETARLLSGLGLISVAAGEVPLTQEEKDAGMRRLNLLSDKDLIAGHFTAGRDHEYHSRDELIRVKGSEAEMGHRWQHALLQAPEMETGYMVANPLACQHLKAATAGLYNVPAIIDFRCESSDAHNTTYRLSFRPGVLRKDVEQWAPALQDELDGLSLALHGSREGAAPSIRVEVTAEAPSALLIHLPTSMRYLRDFGKNLSAAMTLFSDRFEMILPPYVTSDIAQLQPLRTSHRSFA